MFTFNNAVYHYNSYIEFEDFYLAQVLHICYQILGSSFKTKEMASFKDHAIIFFNSDISMYELILDFLKELDISFSGSHDVKEVMYNDRSTC